MHLALGAYIVVARRHRADRGGPGNLFVAGVLAGAAWSAVSAAAVTQASDGWLVAAAVLDVLRYALWFAFLLALIRPVRSASGVRDAALLQPAAMLAVLGALALVLVRGWQGRMADDPDRILLSLSLFLPLCGLLLVEQL